MLLALVVMALFASEYSKDARRKADRRRDLRNSIEVAMSQKDLPGLKRIRLLRATELEELDKGLSARLDDFANEIYIEQDEAARFKKTK